MPIDKSAALTPGLAVLQSSTRNDVPLLFVVFLFLPLADLVPDHAANSGATNSPQDPAIACRCACHAAHAGTDDCAFFALGQTFPCATGRQTDEHSAYRYCLNESVHGRFLIKEFRISQISLAILMKRTVASKSSKLRATRYLGSGRSRYC
jgi:hypothetical protein